MRRFLPILFLLLLVPTSVSAAPAGKILNKLEVRAETNKGYDRDLFDHWLDFDGNGCDTRDEVLLRQNMATRKTCESKSGRWFSAYDGLWFTDPGRLDIDHFVPLAEAWGSGAWRWRPATRDLYANDLYGYSLLAVSASSNRSKSDRDPSEWLPPKTSYVCSYLSRWIAVKYRWRLSVDSREKKALSSGLGSCRPGQTEINKLARARVAIDPGANENPGEGDLDPRFSSCAEAKSAGYGPYFRDRDPEYYWYRDGDGDGVVCE